MHVCTLNIYYYNLFRLFGTMLALGHGEKKTAGISGMLGKAINSVKL